MNEHPVLFDIPSRPGGIMVGLDCLTLVDV